LKADTVTDSNVNEINSGFKARLECVLDRICVEARDGGSHAMRRFIAEKLIATAETGERSLEKLAEVGASGARCFCEPSITKTA
jgi:hypothetical protein